MYFYQLTLVAFSCLFFFEHVSAIGRDDIIKQYKPRLSEQAATFSNQFQISTRQSLLIVQQLKNNTAVAVSIVDAQIKNLKAGIDLAKKQAANKPQALQCIASQEEASKSLTAAGINQTCGIPDLNEVNKISESYQLLARVANLTLNACGLINPLIPGQDQEFLSCVTQKSVDLDQQFISIEGVYDLARTSVMNQHVQCLTTSTNPIVQKVNAINFQVTLCLSTNFAQ